MQKINTLIVGAFCLLLTVNTFAQEGRYLQEVFSEVTVTENVKYGENATLLYFAEFGEAIKQDLVMDVYEPVGDARDERPLVILMHTGNFLPPVTNGGIQGLHTDNSAVEICTRLAKMGYTAVSADYRLGWNPLAGSQPERALGLIQAAYRGVQDGRTCVRFFKDNYTNGGNTFKIDPDRITAWGNGTGGYIVLGMVGLDNSLEISQTLSGPGKFVLDIDGDGTPDVPMVVEAYHGDIEGKNNTVTPDDAFLYPAGDTSCYANFPEESSDFHLAVNVGGALGDESWLNAGDVPTISFHSPDDVFAPYVDDVLVVPTTNEPIVRVQGSFTIAKIQDEFGNNDAFNGVSDVITDKAKENSATAGHDYYSGLFPWVKPVNDLGLDEGVVIDWWEPTDPSPVTSPAMGAPWNMIPHPSGMGTFHDVSQTYNRQMSADKAKANIDEIIAFFAPRAYAALDLGLVNTENVLAETVSLEVAPNPVTSSLTLTSAESKPMLEAQLFDVQGRLINTFDNINSSSFQMDRGNTPDGVYIMMISFEDGVVSKKLIFE